MIISFASGKGGTGKTTFSTAFALASREKTVFIDCDVEEPDSHFFLKPVIKEIIRINVPVPVIYTDTCSSCGRCVQVCRYNAIALAGTAGKRKKPVIFSDLCHSCGGCVLSCPENALTESEMEIGTVYRGISCINAGNQIDFYQGKLDIGIPKSPPLIKKLRKTVPDNKIVLIDTPPGTSCPMVAAVSGSDYAVLVTEPTPFGLNDLKIAVETVKKMSIPFGLIINRAGNSFNKLYDYCIEESIDILLTVPESRAAAEEYSRGGTILDIYPELYNSINSIIKKLLNRTCCV